MKASFLLFIIALCTVSCSNNQASRIEASRIPTTESIITPTDFEQTIAPELTATPEMALMPTATMPVPAGPDAYELLTNALSKMGGVGTFHFAMDKQIYMDEGANELAAHIPVNGKFNTPDKVEGTIILFANEKKAILDFIIVGEDLYLREQNSDSWQKLDWQSQAAQTVRENAYLPLEQLTMDNLSNPTLVGEALLGGLPVYHIRGGLGQQVEGQTTADGNSIDFWIGKDNHLIYRTISQKAGGASDQIAVNGRTVVQVDYARFGEPVLIVAPRVDESGGFRPTGSYPTADLLNGSPDEEEPEATDSSSPAANGGFTSENSIPEAESSVN